MIALLLNLPAELIERESQWSTVEWSHAVPNPQRKLSQAAREYYGGPFFDPKDKLRTTQTDEMLTLCAGEFLHNALIPAGVSLGDSVPSLEVRTESSSSVLSGRSCGDYQKTE